MKKFLFSFTLLTATIGFSSCQADEDTVCQFHFWTSINTAVEDWTLYIDGNSVGTLSHPEYNPTCGGNLSSLINLALPSDNHTFKAVDANGTIRNQGSFKVNHNESRLSGKNNGALTAVGDCDCMIINLYE